MKGCFKTSSLAIFSTSCWQKKSFNKDWLTEINCYSTVEFRLQSNLNNTKKKKLWGRGVQTFASFSLFLMVGAMLQLKEAITYSKSILKQTKLFNNTPNSTTTTTSIQLMTYRIWSRNQFAVEPLDAAVNTGFICQLHKTISRRASEGNHSMKKH